MCDFFRVFQTILRFFKMFSVEVQLFYNAVLVSAVQQSELVTCVWLSHCRRVRLFAASWTVTHQAPLSTGRSRQEYYSGLPCPSPGNLPDPGIKPTSPVSPTLQADSLSTEPPGKPML